MRSPLPLTSILVKPAGPDCNLRCRYCFYLEKADYFHRTAGHRMSDEILEAMIRQTLAGCRGGVSFGWQGGEPTLMGLDFFKKAVAFQEQYGRGLQVSNGLQTNGILLDEQWAAFLARYRFLVGLSLDGPEHVHDHYRRTAADGPTWKQVSDRAAMLLKKGVEVNAISVVSDYSVHYPEEIYTYFKSAGLTFMQFIPCVELDPDHPTEAAPFAVDPSAFGTFLTTLFDLWWDDFDGIRPTTSIRYFEALFHAYVEAPPAMCTLQQECGTYIVVEHTGDVFSCDFYVDDDHRLGNVMEGDLAAMLNSPRQRNFGKKKGIRHDDCQQCEWLTYCWGGCPKDRLNNPAGDGLSRLCPAYRMLLSHAHERMSGLAEEWKKANGWDT
ncbi:anaerobic sulfatase maturase [bacterium]|nr:anaerobic sulfatase maturase [bacterium]